MAIKEEILKIEITGSDTRIPVDSFLELFNSALKVLGELDKSIAHSDDTTVQWSIVSASLNSPMIISVSTDNGSSAAGSKIIQAYLTGLEAIEKGVDQPPRYFTETALYKAKAMVSVLNDGIRQIKFSTLDGLTVIPSLKTAHHIDDLLLADVLEINDESIEPDVKMVIKRAQPRFEEKATIIGKLEGVKLHGESPTFFIYDQLTGNETSCSFAKGDENRAIEYIKHRVSVTGRARYGSKGQVTSLVVDNFKKLRDRKELPQARDLEHINFTNGLNPTEYIRSLRDA